MNYSDIINYKQQLERQLNNLIRKKKQFEEELLILDDELTLAQTDIDTFDRIADSIVGIQANNYIAQLPFEERSRIELEEHNIINAFNNLNNNSKPNEINNAVADILRFRNSPFNEARAISSKRTSAIMDRFYSFQDMNDIDVEMEGILLNIHKINNDILDINSEITLIDNIIKQDNYAANILSNMKEKGGKRKSIKKRKSGKKGGMNSLLNQQQDPLDLMEQGIKVSSPKDRKTRRKNVTVECPYSLEEKCYPSGEFGKPLTSTRIITPKVISRRYNTAIKPRPRSASINSGGRRKTKTRKNRI
jgi:hypothetical protein